ncbi:MAG: GYD domain-containing protein [Anaerolineae bacterium]|nr:GYD domain-containing protein [Anaerolineae bacterium]
MPRYVVLANLTEQGIKNIKEAPAGIEAVAEALESAGGKLIDFYVVMGDYDYVVIAEVPSDEVALVQLFSVSMVGDVRTTTLRAFTREEFAKVIQELP